MASRPRKRSPPEVLGAATRAGEGQEAAQPRSWWRRMFGG
jgi:hypothetical protein